MKERLGLQCDNIKIVPCVEGDRSDCQPRQALLPESLYTESLYSSLASFISVLFAHLQCKTQKLVIST